MKILILQACLSAVAIIALFIATKQSKQKRLQALLSQETFWQFSISTIFELSPWNRGASRLNYASVNTSNPVPQSINQRKTVHTAIKTLQENEEKFRQIVETVQEVLWMSSPVTQQFLYASPSFESVWGYSCEKLYEHPQSYIETVHPDDREIVAATIQQPLKTGFDMQYRLLRRDGSVRWIRDRGFPVQDSGGQIYRMVGIAEDITERKRAEEEIRFVKTMAQAIFESSDFHSALKIALEKVCEATHWVFGEAWVPRPDGVCLECSPAWYSKTESLTAFRRQSETFSFSLGTGIPGRIWATKRPEWCSNVSIATDDTYLRTQMALEVGLKAALGIPLMANDEVIAILVFYMFESREEDQRLIEVISASTELGLFVQRKQAEEEIRKNLQKERELNELKSRFVSMTSHEFRTPLTTILSSAELLERYHDQMSEEKQLIHLHRIQNSTRHMVQLLNAVLLIGKAEASKIPFDPAPIDLMQFCQELVEEFQLIGSRHTISFFQQGTSTGCMDERLLRPIFTNLLSNAVKYSPAGSTIQFSLVCDGTKATFQVQDQGIGIPLDCRNRLFESFHRAKNVGNIPGTGLGLTIVKQCVDLHGGQISVRSEMGRGSTFTVVLPVDK
jgi:PAS domain S-box-containing protein